MSEASTTFAAVYAALTDARCQVRVGRSIVERALCAGIDVVRESTERGQYGRIDANVRILSADEPGGEIKTGTVIEVLQEGQTAWRKVRVGGRHTIGGVTRLSIEAVHE